MEIVAETNRFVLIYKPAGLAVESRKITEKDLIHALGKRAGEVFVINRIDQPVEGLVLFAKDPKSAAFLSREMQEGRMKKEYLAVVEGKPEKKSGTLIDWLEKNGRTNRSEVTAPGSKGAKKAELFYEVCGSVCSDGAEYSLLLIRLKTGRHHQIRVQLSHMGHPIAGDRKYGDPEKRDSDQRSRFPALCAYRLTFRDPETGSLKTYSRDPEGELFRDFESLIREL